MNYHRISRISSIILPLLLVALFGLGGCVSTGHGPGAVNRPDHRPTDFTLGVVVVGSEDAELVINRSARYIVDAAGYLRVSVGDGSSSSTYPPIIRPLSREQLDLIWELVNETEAEHALNTQNRTGFPKRLRTEIEVRSQQKNNRWFVTDESADNLIQQLADLAWIRE